MVKVQKLVDNDLKAAGVTDFMINYDDLKSRIENGKRELRYNVTGRTNLTQDNSSNLNRNSI
jgi:hypothetical protein